MSLDDKTYAPERGSCTSPGPVLDLAADAVTEGSRGFLAYLSHELHTPLNAILGFSEFLIDEKPGPLNARQKEYLNDILTSGRQLLHLINDVVELAKLEAGQIQVVPELFELSEAIDQVLAAVAQHVLHKHIWLRTSQAPQLGKVLLDRGKLLRILQNLLSNAIERTREGGEINIQAELQGTTGLRLIVEYPACGMREGDLHMALTRKLIETQQGVLTINNEVASGSVVRVFLPLQAPTTVGCASSSIR